MQKAVISIVLLLGFIAKLASAQLPLQAALRNKVKSIAATAKGNIGVALTLLESGDTVLLNGEQRFPMQSVYKLPIALAVLHRVDQGKLRLNQKVRVTSRDFVTKRQHSPIQDKSPQGTVLSIAELLRFMVSESDGTACDVLLRLLGSPRAANGYLQQNGLTGLQIATTENTMGRDPMAQYRNWATPKGMTELLRALHQGRVLSASSRALLLRLMTETTTGLRRIKGLLPAGTVVAHKTGTDSTVHGLTRATNDVGIVTLPNGRHLAVVVFLADSRANEAVREGVIAKIARAGWDNWSQHLSVSRPRLIVKTDADSTPPASHISRSR